MKVNKGRQLKVKSIFLKHKLIIIIFFTITVIAVGLLYFLLGMNSKVTTLAYPLKNKQAYYFDQVNVLGYDAKKGNRKIYIYSSPIEFSNNEITVEKNQYAAYGVNYKKYMPKELNAGKGIVVGNKQLEITIPGDSTYKSELVEKENIFKYKSNTVVYKDVFGKGYDYSVTPTYAGFNTEITIPKYEGKYSFRIKLSLPATDFQINSPDYTFFINDDSNIYSIAYTPMVSDKKGNWSFNNLVSIAEINTEEKYFILEYIVDDTFLKSKNTKYPVKLNQTVCLYTENQPDTSIYSDVGDVRHYKSPYMFLGKSTVKGEGKAYIRYETLLNLNIDPDKIIKANYVFRNLFDLDKKAAVSVHAVSSEWCSINTIWEIAPTTADASLAKIKVKKKGDYSIDITEHVKEMIRNKDKEDMPISIRNGFMLKCDTDECLVIATGDSNIFSPYLVIEVKP